MMTAQDFSHFGSSDDVEHRLQKLGYVATREVADTVFLADALAKPVLVEGPAGTGKTELAIAIAGATSRPLIRLQCHEGIDEARALYEWDYRKQLLSIQSGASQDVADVFSEQFLIARPLLQAVRSPEPVVLLIDEVDQLDPESEALLLELLSAFQVTIPEIGTLRSVHSPSIVLTSNGNRDLSDALRRRCLYLHIGYPPIDREAQIIRARLPGVDAELAHRVAQTTAALRSFDLKKAPSVSEALDWARTLMLLGAVEVNDELLLSHANVLIKHQSDIDRLSAHLSAAAAEESR